MSVLDEAASSYNPSDAGFVADPYPAYRDHFAALNSANGHSLWTSSIGDGTAITVAGGAVYVGVRGPRYGGVYKANGKTGRLIWKRRTAQTPTT